MSYECEVILFFHKINCFSVTFHLIIWNEWNKHAFMARFNHLLASFESRCISFCTAGFQGLERCETHHGPPIRGSMPLLNFVKYSSTLLLELCLCDHSFVAKHQHRIDSPFEWWRFNNWHSAACSNCGTRDTFGHAFGKLHCTLPTIRCRIWCPKQQNPHSDCTMASWNLWFTYVRQPNSFWIKIMSIFPTRKYATQIWQHSGPQFTQGCDVNVNRTRRFRVDFRNFIVERVFVRWGPGRITQEISLQYRPKIVDDHCPTVFGAINYLVRKTALLEETASDAILATVSLTSVDTTPCWCNAAGSVDHLPVIRPWYEERWLTT